MLSFSADAYRNEMGITSPLQPNDNTLLGDPVDDGVRDPEDATEPFGQDVPLFADFMRALSAPPRLLPSAKKELKEIEEGFKVFKSVGCSSCHLPELETASGANWSMPKHFGFQRRWATRNFIRTAISFCTISEPGPPFCVKACLPKLKVTFVRPRYGAWARGWRMANPFSMTAACALWKRPFSDTKTARRRKQRASGICANWKERGC